MTSFSLTLSPTTVDPGATFTVIYELSRTKRIKIFAPVAAGVTFTKVSQLAWTGVAPDIGGTVQVHGKVQDQIQQTITASGSLTVTEPASPPPPPAPSPPPASPPPASPPPPPVAPPPPPPVPPPPPPVAPPPPPPVPPPPPPVPPPPPPVAPPPPPPAPPSPPPPPVSPPPPPPVAVAYPKVASTQQNSGESWADSVIRTLTYGFNGAVRYLPAGTLPAWDSAFQTLASKAGTQPIHIQLTAKTHDDAGLKAVLTNLPDAWRPGFKYNIFQEPEDNMVGDAAAQQAYRNNYTAAANVTRAHNAPNPGKAVSLPWLELAEYSLLLKYVNNDLSRDPVLFRPPSSDYAGVLWSLFEYSEKDRVDAQIARIVRCMSETFPGKPWALMAGNYTLEPGSGPFTDAQLQAQAAWLKKHYANTKAAGSVGWAWYNVNFAGTGGAAGEGRVEKNPYLNGSASWVVKGL